jgi:Type IV secretion-system coupling protein DNA-binding domain
VAPAKRQTFREWICDLVYPEWLKPKQGTPPPSGTAQPKQPPATVRATGALPHSQAPNGHPQVTLIPASAPKRQNPPTVLGNDCETGEEVSLSLNERLQGLYVIGATGTGKTTLLLNMILSDIRTNHGLCLIEPHGDLTKNVIAAMPERRVKDLIYLDLTDSTASFGLNFFECRPGADVSEVAKVASFVQHLFEAVWSAQTETTPRLAQVLRNTTRVLIENPGMTFAEISLLLWEDGAREKLVRRVTNTQTKLFWSQYNRRDPRAREELIASTINKVDAYLNEPLVARIVSQSASTIDFRRVMDEGKILLVHLSPQLEEPSRLIGAAILGRLLMAAFSLADIPPEKRRPFMIYADEYQRFATNDFAVFLAEARKSGICSTIANQTLEQLSDLNRATALQAGSLVVGRVSGEDAKILAKSFDVTPGMEQIGLEPLRSPVADIIGHLVRNGHSDQRLAKFTVGYLRAFERYCSEKLEDGHPAYYNCFYNRLMLTDSQVRQARSLLNTCLYRCMCDKNADISIDPLAIYVLAAAQDSGGMEHAFSPFIKSQPLYSFGPHELLGFHEAMASFGRPTWRTDCAKSFARMRTKFYPWMAEYISNMLTELAYCIGVLASEPLLAPTGQFVPQMRQRSYQDQENLISNTLSSQLPNFHAKVRILTAEHTIKTRPGPKLISEPEVEERIRAIKERMLSLGYTRDARAIEEEVAKRHEALRQRPPDVVPQIHTTGRRNGRQKPPVSP